MPRITFALVLIGLLLAACQPLTMAAPQSPLATPTAAPAQWTTLRMDQSGGIMGLHRSVEITSAGRLTATDERTKQTVTLQLSKEQMADLQKLISAASYVTPEVPMVCADCFVYEMSIERGTGKPWMASVDDTSIADSGLAPLIEYVRTLMEKALKP
jgi:hypothetical protein